MHMTTPASSVAPRALQKHPVPPASQARRCLVVDDDALARRWLVARLERLGLDVVDCDGARAADRLLQQEAFSVVILDCVLEDGDGYTIARSIRQRPQEAGPAMWIVGLSASTGEAHERACRAAGMDAVLCKPPGSLALLAALEGYVDEAAQVAPPAETDDVDRKVRAALRTACLEERQLLKIAIDAVDGRRVRHHAHRLRGTALLAGMSVIAEEAAALEEASRLDQWTAIASISARIFAVLGADES